MNDVAVIGLGRFGRAIARNLLSAGHVVTVWNRSPGSVAELVAQGARAAESVVDALQSGVVLSLLTNDEAVAEVFLDSGVLAHAPEGAVHANLSTVSAELTARAAEEHASHGVGYLAAPMLGGLAAAEAGELSILVAGEDALIDRVEPFLAAIGRRTWRVGERAERANLIKILNNYLLFTSVQALGETISLAEQCGVDAGQLMEILNSTGFSGPAHTVYGRIIAERRFRPAGAELTLGRKDLHLALDAAAEHGLVLPFGEVMRETVDRAIEAGYGDADWSSIAELLPRAEHPGAEQAE